jgi:hypothetical protein
LVCDELVQFGYNNYNNVVNIEVPNMSINWHYRLADEQAKQITQLKTISTFNLPKLPKLNDVKWRIDVTISTR